MANKCNGQIYCVKKVEKIPFNENKRLVKSGKNYMENFFKKRRLKIKPFYNFHYFIYKNVISKNFSRKFFSLKI